MPDNTSCVVELAPKTLLVCVPSSTIVILSSLMMRTVVSRAHPRCLTSTGKPTVQIEIVGSEQESVRVLILGSFLKVTFLVLNAVGKRESYKNAGKPWVSLWKFPQRRRRLPDKCKNLKTSQNHESLQ